jgi:hypothetical protein
VATGGVRCGSARRVTPAGCGRHASSVSDLTDPRKTKKAVMGLCTEARSTGGCFVEWHAAGAGMKQGNGGAAPVAREEGGCVW